MRARLFWKLGLTYLALLLVVLFVVDIYSVRVVRAQAIRSANDALGSLLNTRPRAILQLCRRHHRTSHLDRAGWRKSGARVTVIDSTGRVLADSAARFRNDGESREPRRRFRRLWRLDQGQSVRRSVTLNRDLVYRAVRYQPPAESSDSDSPRAAACADVDLSAR